MPACSVAVCRNNSKHTKRVIYHAFPKDLTISALWVNKCKRADSINTKHGRVCSNHFDENSYKDDLRNRLLGLPPRKFLKEDAVPSLNLQTSDECHKGESCKKRWRSIRDHFMREKKDMSGTGKAAKKRKRAAYWESLSFLYNASDERQGFTNAELEEGATEETLYVTDNTEFNVEDERNSNNPNTDEKENDDQSIEDDIDADEPNRQLTFTPHATKNNSTSSRPTKRDKTNDVVISLLKQRQTDKNKLLDCVEKMFRQEEKHPENENDLFFKSMAAIVNKFDNRNQAIARNKIFAIVSDMEMSQYSVPSTSSNAQVRGSPNFMDSETSSYQDYGSSDNKAKSPT